MPAFKCLTPLFLAGGPLVAPGPPMANNEEWRPSSAGYVDHDTLPVRCHWGLPEDAEICTDVLAAVELSWEAQVDGAGFTAPLPDDDDILDMYITAESASGGAYAYGACSSSEVAGRMGCHAYLVIDPDFEPDLLDLTVAHEFNHVLQYGTDFVEPSYPIWEATATAAQRWTYPDAPLDLEFIEDFQTYPWVGVLGDGYALWDDYDIWSYHEYGAVLWIMHLDHHWGDGAGAAGAALWWAAIQEGNLNEPDVVDAYDTVTGDWVDALMNFSVERSLIHGPAPAAWAAELNAARFRTRPEAVLEGAPRGEVITPEYGAWATGMVLVTVQDAPAGTLTVRTTDTDLRLGFFTVPLDQPEAAVIVTDADSLTALIEAGTHQVGVVSLGDSGWDADMPLVHADFDIIVDLSTDAGGDSGDGGDGGDGGTPAKGGDNPQGDKGCGVLPAAPAGAWLLLGLGALARRRR